MENQYLLLLSSLTTVTLTGKGLELFKYATKVRNLEKILS